MAPAPQKLSPSDRDRIAAAVAEAEARTSGEIICVVAQEASDYREVALAWAAGVALLAPPLAFLAGVRPLTPAEALGGWSVAQSSAADARLGLAITLYAVAQTMLFVAVALLTAWPPLRRRLTPRALRDRRVHRAALQHFLGTGVHLGPGRTGVLIYASVGDRRIEIVADEAIHAQVGQAAWDQVIADAVGELRRGGPADGLIRAVQLCGMLLAQHFPDDRQPNAYPDRPLEV